MVFNHSIKVPTQYRRAAAIFKKAIIEGKPVKTLIFEEKHAKIPNLLALLSKYSKYKDLIESAIDDTGILIDNPRLDPFLCRVLVTELFYGTKNLKGASKPVTCIQSYQEKLGDHLKSEGDNLNVTQGFKPRYVRINTNIISLEEALQLLKDDEWRQTDKTFQTYDTYLEAVKNIEEDQYLIDFHVPTVLVFHPKWRTFWACHDYVAQKKFMLQDKATSLVGQLLDPPLNSVVWDMCAAPGMKTIHLSNLMNNSGTIYAVEQNESRYNTLCDLVQRSNATSVKTIMADALTVDNDQVPGVEYILVDPSCSGSGIENRISLANDVADKVQRLKKLRVLQVKLLRHAMTKFPDVKRIVYSTCSLEEEENEQVVQRCLQKCPNFKLLNGKKLLQRQWKNFGNTNYTSIGKNCIYARPNVDLTDGIFMAVFEKIKSE